jgi:hypothetical protein
VKRRSRSHPIGSRQAKSDVSVTKGISLKKTYYDHGTIFQRLPGGGLLIKRLPFSDTYKEGYHRLVVIGLVKTQFAFPLSFGFNKLNATLE